jgi:hypothetical protein
MILNQLKKRYSRHTWSRGEKKKTIQTGGSRGALSQQQKCVIFEKKAVKSVVTVAVESGATSSDKGRGGNCEPSPPPNT